MIDEFSIQQTLNCYSEGASRADWDQVVSTFMPDSVWEIPSLSAKFEGHKAIRDGLVAFTAPMDYIVQLNTPAIMKVDGDTATARSVIRECGKYSGRDEALEVLGFYADRLVRTPDGWKFTRRTFEVRGMHSFPLQPPARQ
ncbi:MAG: nuclear transport factor 2 family protein [Rhizomicrobium sp.]